MLFETNATGKSSVLDAPRQMSNPGTSRAVKEAFNLPHRDTPINSFSVGNRGLKGLIKRKRAYSNKANPMKRLTHVRAIDMRLNWRDGFERLQNGGTQNELGRQCTRRQVVLAICRSRRQRLARRRPIVTVERAGYGTDAALLDRMVRAVVEEVAPEQVILFGSRARGDAAAESDYDLIVVESEAFGEGRSRDAEEVRLYRALAGISASVDVLVYCQDEVDYWRGSLNHILARALREGKVLYEQSQERRCLKSDTKQVCELSHARELLDAAERGMSALRGMEDADVFADEIYGFHVQQAIEKSFKAWLALLGEKYPTTHDLAILLEPLKEREPEAAGFEDLAEFTRFAVRFRCMQVEPDNEPLDRGAILPRVEVLQERVRRLAETGQQDDALGIGEHEISRNGDREGL